MSTSWGLSTRRGLRGLPTLAVGLLVACAHGPSPRLEVAAGDREALGIQVRSLDEGLLVEGVHPGSGAAQAGLVPGDLIVSVDGIAVRDAPTAALYALRGPSGSSAELVLRSPLSGDYRDASALRGVAGESGAVTELPPVVTALRRALERGGAGAARRAAKDAVVARFGDMEPADALGTSLRTAVARRPRVARAAAEVLALQPVADDRLDFELGLAWSALGEPERARDALQRSEATRPADAWEPGGTFVGDAGGNPLGRRLLAEAQWTLGERDAAIAQGRSLLESWELPALAASLGMAPPRAPQPWRTRLPPLDEVVVDTLQGGTWRLSEHRGQVVVLSFFATWCGPCRQELPQLQQLWARRRDQGVVVLGVSMDDAADAGAVPAYLDQLGVDFPAAWAPELGRRFAVEGIPGLRVVGPSGSLVHSLHGYSPEVVPWLDGEVQALLQVEDAAGEALLGRGWSRGRAELAGFLALEGAQDVVLTDADLAIGRTGGPPVVMAGSGGGADSTVEGPGGGALLAWLDGPVASEPGQRWVRATTRSGRPRWLLTTTSPVRAMVAEGERLWIATDDRVLAVDALGRLVVDRTGGGRGLAPHPAGGVWLVDAQHRLHLAPQGDELQRLPADGAWLVDASGRVASRVFEDMLTARFGPGGALRTVVVRYDGTVVGLDAVGRPALTWELDAPARLAAGDIDGDGQDELLVAVRGQGLATLTLSLP